MSPAREVKVELEGEAMEVMKVMKVMKEVEVEVVEVYGGGGRASHRRRAR